MAVTTSEGLIDNQPDQPNNNTTPGAAQAFGGTTFTGAPTGSNDFLGLRRSIGLDRGDSAVDPYLQEVLKNIQTKLPDVKYERMQKMSSGYAFRYEGPDGYVNFFGILFVSTSEPSNIKMVPASMRMQPMLDELRERYAAQSTQIRLVDARVIITGYQPEMERTFEMADCIVRTFNVTSNPAAKNAKIDSLIGTEFSANWSLHDARKLERALSPHGVAPRMDFALTLNAKIQHDFGRALREHEIEYEPLGVIGGYTETRAKEPFTVNGVQKMLYRPVVVITVCNSVIPLEGIATILLSAFAGQVYNSKWWASGWTNLGPNEPNPGLLEEDHQNPGRPYELKTKEDLNAFIDEWFAAPEIAFSFQDGRDIIPGFLRIAATKAEEKNHFGERITQFYGTGGVDLSNVLISHIFETRSEGVYGDSSGTLFDSRDVDYLWIAAKNGAPSIDQQTRNVLIVGSENIAERAQIVANMTGNFTPLYLTTMAAINAGFIKDLIRMTEARGLAIVDPNSTLAARPFGSYITGFDSSVGVGSLISSGQYNRGLGLNSVWGV